MSDQHEFIKRLANNMLLVPIRVGRLSLEVKTKKGAEAVKSALNIGENVRAGSSVGALGAMTDLAAELLNRPAGYASTYKYKRTLPSGEPIYRMAMTTKLPEHLARFNDHNNMIIKGMRSSCPSMRTITAIMVWLIWVTLRSRYPTLTRSGRGVCPRGCPSAD